ncbi:MAG: DUF1850 domain-containing protein [Synergistaceae bacterium]|nr:DUF1850 domain-containing protein [Synergistaceae bacterium]
MNQNNILRANCILCKACCRGGISPPAFVTTPLSLQRRLVFFAALLFVWMWTFSVSASTDSELYLRIRDWKTGEIYAASPAKIGDVVFFGWIHSLEKIPWNEYYHIGEDRSFILDAITFPAFGAGIPENKGRVCYVENGLIHMEEIDEKFEEIVWLNSHTATQEIMLDRVVVAKGDSLPQHSRLRMAVEMEK